MITKHKPISAGEFRHPVTIMRPFHTDDGAGGQNVVWQEAGMIFCAVVDAGGSEPYSDSGSGRIRSQERYKFYTWWRDDLEQTDKLSFRGSDFNIREINNHNFNNKFMEITAETGVEQ